MLLLGSDIHLFLEGVLQRGSSKAFWASITPRVWYQGLVCISQAALEQRVPETQSQKLSWFWGPAKNVAHTKE